MEKRRCLEKQTQVFHTFMLLMKRWLFTLRDSSMHKRDSGKWKDCDLLLKEDSVKLWAKEQSASISFSGLLVSTGQQLLRWKTWMKSHSRWFKRILMEWTIMWRTLEGPQDYYCLLNSLCLESKNSVHGHQLTQCVSSSCSISILAGTGDKISWGMC